MYRVCDNHSQQNPKHDKICSGQFSGRANRNRSRRELDYIKCLVLAWTTGAFCILWSAGHGMTDYPGLDTVIEWVQDTK